MAEEITATQNVVNALRDLKKDNKELPEDKKKDLEDNEKHLDELRKQKANIITAYAAGESYLQGFSASVHGCEICSMR